MATIVSMPKWGLAMKTGLVVAWLKQAGEVVRQGEPIVEIESEKATNEIESPASGIMRWIGIQEGDSAPVGEPLAIIAASDETLSDEQVVILLREDAEARRQRAEMQKKPTASPLSAKPASSGGAVRAPTAAGGRVNASPAARRLAQELGVDLSTIVGTGPGGIVGREDVLRASEAAKETQAASEEVEERDITVDGVTVHCLLAGPLNGPHVVFVHGLGGSLATWSLNLPAFAEQFRICALDLPGAGDSAKPEMDYSAPALAAFLARFLDALGPDWQRISLVGHSLGGAIALSFAEQYPQRVEQLILVDSAGLGLEIDAEVLNLMRSQPTPDNVRAELTHFFAQTDFVQQSLVEQVYRQRTLPDAHAALVATANAAFGNGQQHIDLRDTLPGLNAPILFVWGAADAVISVTHAEQATRAPLSHLEIFSGCGHCPHIEQADAFNRLALSFLRQ